MPAATTPLTTLRTITLPRWWPAPAILGLGFLMLIPTWIVLPPDDEGLFIEVQSTAFLAKHIFHAWLWDPFIGFGVPQPFGQSLEFHPFLLFVRFLPLAFSLGLLYQLQIWLALFSVWAVARHLGLARWIAALCTFTFALSAATVEYLQDFWPSLLTAWTLSPLLLLLGLKLLDAPDRRRRALFSVAVGICSGLMFLDGHAGVFPLVAFGFIVFAAGSARQARAVWQWLGVAVLVWLLLAGTKVYELASEAARSTGSVRDQQVYGMDWGNLFFYPVFARANGYRLIAIGGPFFALALIGLVWRRVDFPYRNGLRAAVVLSFLAWFFPVSAVPVISGNWFADNPFTLFAVFLAGMTLHALWREFPTRRGALAALAALQVVVLTWGFYGYYRDNFARAYHYLRGTPVPTLKESFVNYPLYRYFEQRPDRTSTRVLMAPNAEDRLWRSLTESDVSNADGDYEFPAWELHGLRLLNGHFRGVDTHVFHPVHPALHGEIRANSNLPLAQQALDVFNVGYVLAEPTDKVAPGFQLLRRFNLANGGTIAVYRNPAAWPDAVVLDPAVRRISSLPLRAGCDSPGLLCASFARVAPLRRTGAVIDEHWHGTGLRVRLRPTSGSSVLMLSQMYRPGWQATLSGGRTVHGFQVLGGFTGFDLPAGTQAAEIDYRPATRIVLELVSWLTLLGGLVAVAGLAAWPYRPAWARR